MEPSSLPQRTKGLTRTSTLARGGPIRRRPVDPTDPEEEMKEAIRLAVYRRDGQCRLRRSTGAGPCSGKKLTPHHLWKSGQGGPWSIRNILTLCAGHNGRVETMRTEARAWGLEMTRGQTYTELWALLHLAGITTYWWDGSVAYLASPDCVRAADAAEPALHPSLIAALAYDLGQPDGRPRA